MKVNIDCVGSKLDTNFPETDLTSTYEVMLLDYLKAVASVYSSTLDSSVANDFVFTVVFDESEPRQT